MRSGMVTACTQSFTFHGLGDKKVKNTDKKGQIYNFCNQKSLFGAFVAVEFCIIQVEGNII